MSKPRRRKQKKQVKPELKLRQFASTELSDQLAALPCAADLPRFMVDTVAGAYAPADAELMIEGFGAAATRPVTLRAPFPGEWRVSDGRRPPPPHRLAAPCHCQNNRVSLCKTPVFRLSDSFCSEGLYHHRLP